MAESRSRMHQPHRRCGTCLIHSYTTKHDVSTIFRKPTPVVQHFMAECSPAYGGEYVFACQPNAIGGNTKSSCAEDQWLWKLFWRATTTLARSIARPIRLLALPWAFEKGICHLNGEHICPRWPNLDPACTNLIVDAVLV